MFKQGQILKSKERTDFFPKFVMVLHDLNPNEMQFKAVVLFCKTWSVPLPDEEPGYVSNAWNVPAWEVSSWEELKEA